MYMFLAASIARVSTGTFACDGTQASAACFGTPEPTGGLAAKRTLGLTCTNGWIGGKKTQWN